MKKNEENLEKHIEKFSSGKIKKEWSTLNGELHGELKTYLLTGEIIKKVIFNQGVLEKICDYRSDIEYDREFFINHLEIIIISLVLSASIFPESRIFITFISSLYIFFTFSGFCFLA